MKKSIIFLFFMAIMAITLFSGCESEAPLPVESQPPRVDSLYIFDTTVFYDSTTVFVIIDSVRIPCDSLVYQDCRILKDGTTTETLGAPGYFVTVKRDKVNGHGIKFCLYVYRQDDGYTGVLSATHLKSDWPVVYVDVTVNSDPPFVWKLDAQHQVKEIVF